MFEIGNTLREARLRRGLDILDCEAETKIRTKYLRAMEEEQFDLMPSPTYVRGFLRTYADFLDLDGRLVLDEYESRFGSYRLTPETPGRVTRPGVPETPRRRAGSEPPRATRPRRRRRTEVQLLWLAIGGVMAVALLVWMGVGETPPPAVIPPSGAKAATGREAAPAVAEPDKPTGEAPVPTKKTSIVLSGVGTYGCYVEVRGRNSKGRLVFQQILLPGQSKEFKVLDGIWVRATNPAELKVTVGGKVKSLDSSVGGIWLISTTGVKSVG
jgi:cytoskeleton protein RodZ